MSNWVKCLLLILVLATLLVIYYVFDPSGYVWFPKCMFFMLTGLECPACGSQRAVNALLHGSILEALRFNPFIIISLPYGFGLILILIFKSDFMTKLRSILLHRYVVMSYVVLYMFWWILRNLI